MKKMIDDLKMELDKSKETNEKQVERQDKSHRELEDLKEKIQQYMSHENVEEKE